MFDFPQTAAEPSAIDGQLADRLYRELDVALGDIAVRQAAETREVDVSAFVMPGRVDAARPVFRSSRTNRNFTDLPQAADRKMPSERHADAAFRMQRLFSNFIGSGRVASDGRA